LHRVLESHLAAFKELHELTFEESKLFESFTAFTLAGIYSFDELEPETLVFDGDEPGIDAFLVFINDKCITTLEEAENIFRAKKSDNDVKLVALQSTVSEHWDKAKLNTFESAVLDFTSAKPAHSMCDELAEKKKIFDIVISNLGKVKGGKPSFIAVYTSSADETIPKEIDAAKKAFLRQLESTGLFAQASVSLFGRDRLVEMYLGRVGAYEAKFTIIGSASFPKSDGIEESYVVTVSAKNFAAAVLRDQQGNLRRSIFDENVRDFIAFKDSSINTAMRNSLVSANSTKRFGILNNGITIISPDVRLQSNEMFIANYQVVNGCQTSNVLFDAIDEMSPDATLMVKIIETADQDIVDEIVESTNSQNKIEDHQFLARLDCVKGIEKYFKVRCEDNDQTLYFERRPNQFSNQGLKAIRIFNIKELARCCGAMFFDRPDLSARYPGQLVEELSDSVFNKQNREEIFFAAAFSYYRLKLHLSNQRIDPIFNTLKWHTLMAVKYYLLGARVPDVKNRKIDTHCQTIIDFMSKTDAATMKVWNKIEGIMKQLPFQNRDDLRRSKLNGDLKKIVLQKRQ